MDDANDARHDRLRQLLGSQGLEDLRDEARDAFYREYEEPEDKNDDFQGSSDSLPDGVKGDILYHDGDDWQKLAIGDQYQVLTIGEDGVPVWGYVRGI